MIYEEEASKYKPDKIRYLLIAESPPSQKTKDGKLRYFYFKDVADNDNLLKAIVESIFSEEYKPLKKECWLNKLKHEGIFLIDAVDYPIDNLSKTERKKEIKKNKENLIQHIEKLIDEKLIDEKLINGDTKIILIKKNVCMILFDDLKERGFNVINEELIEKGEDDYFIRFPLYQWKQDFIIKIKKLIKNN